LNRGCAYQYDNLNRLKAATYQKAGTVTNAYNESLTYDKNGNILTLNRNGTSETATAIDKLAYTYSNNQLLKVADASNKTQGFKDGTNTDNDFTYDFNGNMTIDKNKGITLITYNHLNLPIKITFGTTGNIVYVYNATGQKLKKVVTQGTTVTTTDYLGGYQYLNNILQFFPTAEGYVAYSQTLNAYSYVYQYKDHLGNIRLSYSDANNDKLITNNEIVEESNYYPFGLKQTGYNNVTNSLGNSSAQKYKLKGKEWQDELGLNEYAFGFRDYDPAIGRWNVIDPLAEKYITTSPYAFVQNNPLINREIDGRYFDKKDEKQAKKIEKAAEKQANKLEKQANKLIKNGKSAGDLMDRVAELRNSAQDVRDMRSNTSTEFKYGKLDSKQSKALGLQGPTTTQTGTNAKGDNVVTMFVEKNMGNQIHETRHGGDVARGNLSFNNTGGYGVSHEISAYKAQYSYDGTINFIDQTKNPTQADILKSLQNGTNPLQNSINSINSNFVNNLVDPGFAPIYPPASIPLTIWNAN
jgi:RHS repeat-associated protein